MYLQALVSTIVIFLLSAILAILLSASYVKKKTNSTLLWSSGMWLFSISVGLEIIFSVGIFSEGLIRFYTFLVAVLVSLLALGSTTLLKGKMTFYAYTLYITASTIFLLVSLLVTHISNIVLSGIVYGTLPLLVVLSSSFVTFPAAVILILISLISFRKSRQPKLLSIVAGVLVVSVAGTLYIASFPSFLYIAEFIGILLLWIGFVDFSSLFKTKEVVSENVSGNV